MQIINFLILLKCQSLINISIFVLFYKNKKIKNKNQTQLCLITKRDRTNPTTHLNIIELIFMIRKGARGSNTYILIELLSLEYIYNSSQLKNHVQIEK